MNLLHPKVTMSSSGRVKKWYLLSNWTTILQLERKVMKHIMIIILLSLISLYPQAKFNTVLMKKYMRLNQSLNIFPLGDQNGDGYDDFLAYSCTEKKFNIFFGGNPIDTVLALSFYGFHDQYPKAITTIDINHDGKLDIAVCYYAPDTFAPDLEIYLGGKLLDTIPDMQLPKPAYAGKWWGNGLYTLPDFNGDGYSDLAIMDVAIPNHPKASTNSFYFYNTNPVLDTVPKMIIVGDTTGMTYIEDYTFGDINGDGKTDMWFSTMYNKADSNGYAIDSLRCGNLVLGNANWDSTAVIHLKQGQHKWRFDAMQFIGDINGDGGDDIILPSYGNFIYYMQNSILYGNYPLDTIPKVILNTQNNILLRFEKVGDVNGDGYNDFLSRESGGYAVSKLWLGGKDMNTHNLPVAVWGDQDDFFAGVIKGVGDVNGDGVNDFCVGTATTSGTCIDGYFIIFSGDTSMKVGTKDIQSPKTPDYKLDEPYPNPFNPSTTIHYTLGQDSNVKLAIYNTVGQEIQLLLQEEQKAGVHKYEYNGVNLPSGVYFIELTASEGDHVIFRQSKKIILIK